MRNLITDDFLRPGFVLTSPNLSSSNATKGRLREQLLIKGRAVLDFRMYAVTASKIILLGI